MPPITPSTCTVAGEQQRDPASVTSCGGKAGRQAGGQAHTSHAQTLQQDGGQAGGQACPPSWQGSCAAAPHSHCVLHRLITLEVIVHGDPLPRAIEHGQVQHLPYLQLAGEQ